MRSSATRPMPTYWPREFRDVFFDSADQLILDWFVDEETESVRQRLLEHMATNADKCALYEKPVLQIYRDAEVNSLVRSRLESAARRTNLFAIMRKIKYDADVLYEGDQVVAHPKDSQRCDGAPRIFSGTIAAADTLLKNAATRDALRNQFGVRAVEMEASGVQNAAWHQGKDIFVVRGICDYCDAAKNDDWQKYAGLVAAAYARVIVEAMPADWF